MFPSPFRIAPQTLSKMHTFTFTQSFYERPDFGGEQELRSVHQPPVILTLFVTNIRLSTLFSMFFS
jgi:hypothetical protein